MGFEVILAFPHIIRVKDHMAMAQKFAEAPFLFVPGHSPTSLLEHNPHNIPLRIGDHFVSNTDNQTDLLHGDFRAPFEDLGFRGLLRVIHTLADFMGDDIAHGREHNTAAFSQTHRLKEVRNHIKRFRRIFHNVDNCFVQKYRKVGAGESLF